MPYLSKDWLNSSFPWKTWPERLPELPLSFCDLLVTWEFYPLWLGPLRYSIYTSVGFNFPFAWMTPQNLTHLTTHPLPFLFLWPLWAITHLSSSAGRLFPGLMVTPLFSVVLTFSLVVLIVLFCFFFSCGVKSQIVFSFHYFKTLGVK